MRWQTPKSKIQIPNFMKEKELTEFEKKSIQKGIEDLDSGNIYTNDEVMAFSKKRISELKKNIKKLGK